MTNAQYSANKEQKKAIMFNKGSLLIVAGAGTGKTFVITEKIQHLIASKLALPEEILALTFTEKAAREMEERVDKRIPYGYFQMWISTFHSFADHVLKNEAAHIGLSPNFRIMTEAESIIFIRKNFFLFDLKYFRPLGNPNKFIGAMLQHFSRLRDEDVSPKQYIAWLQDHRSHLTNSGQANAKDQKVEEKIETEKYIELANAYKTYQSLKIKESLCDFADLVYYCLNLFRSRKNILKNYQKKFKFALVDEFQDTNIAQYELIKLLYPPKSNPNLTVVGDDSQAIYKFRGASVSNILSFRKDYKSSKQITLLKNYRSNQDILDTAYRLIKNNDPDTLEAQLGISKKLTAVIKKTDEFEPMQLYIANNASDEAEYVAHQISNLIEKGNKFSDIAILVRANNHADAFIQTLSRNSIPFQFLGPGMLFKQGEIKDLIAYLKVLYNPEDSISLYRVLIMDIFDIDFFDIAKLLSFSKKVNLSLFQSMEIYLTIIFNQKNENNFDNYKAYLPLLHEDAKNKIKKTYEMIVKHLRLIKKETAGQILFYFLEDSGYLSKIVNFKTIKEEKISQNISNFFNKIKSFESEHEDASVYAVVEYLEMSLELGESPTSEMIDAVENDAVNILTVHSAKGLEFNFVFLVNLTQGRFPTRERRETIPIPDKLIKEILPIGDYHVEEERRLFYVALTRAKDKIYLTSSRFYGEGKREQKLSPFVSESLGNEFVTKQIVNYMDRKKQLSIFDYKKNNSIKVKEPSKIYFKEQNDIIVSYTQLNVFNHCPLQYKYQYIVRVPTTPSGALSFGDTIHKTLQEFYKRYKDNKKIGLKELKKIYGQLWIPLGYSSHAHETRMKKEGNIMLERYFKKYHTSSLLIIDLEKKFKIKITPSISIVGKIDRIDQLNNKNVEIIDYKTGKKLEEKSLKKDIQLSIYALAATDRKLYGYPLDKVKLSFIFLEPMEKITLLKNAQDLMDAKENIITTVDNIKQKIYQPNVGPWCDFCSFKMICEAWQ